MMNAITKGAAIFVSLCEDQFQSTTFDSKQRLALTRKHQSARHNNIMSDQNTSTLQSAYEKVTGAAQSALGSLTGSTADKAQGEQKKDVAEARHDASKAGATVAGHSVSASGVTPNDPNRQQGSWNQTIGSGKEFVGGALGLEGLKKEGQQQNEEGKAQEAAGQLNDLGSGVANRVAGTVGGAVAGLTGDREEQARRAGQHDQGKTLQRGVESELQKQADAERK